MTQLMLCLPPGSAIKPRSEKTMAVRGSFHEKREVAVAIVVRRHEGNTSVLMVRRADPNENCPRWVFPGGKIDAGESAGAAAKRELKEETGIDVSRPDIIGCRIHPVSGLKIHYISFQYKRGLPRIREPKKLDQIDWVSVDSLGSVVGHSLFAPVEAFLQNSDRSAQADFGV